MSPDLAVELINATVQLEQPLGDGTRTVGTGFLVSAPTPDGKPRTVLITSAHVFDRMPQLDARIGWRGEVPLRPRPRANGLRRGVPRPATAQGDGDGAVAGCLRAPALGGIVPAA